MNIKKAMYGHKWKFTFTLSLVLAEAGIAVLFPLFIGYAIDDALEKVYEGAFYLGILGLLALVVGAGRRFYDSRFYAKVYEDVGAELHSGFKEASPSTKTARLQMLSEIVEFFENNIPQLITSIIGLTGTLFIVFTLNLNVFWLCLIILLLVIIVYGITPVFIFGTPSSFFG